MVILGLGFFLGAVGASISYEQKLREDTAVPLRVAAYADPEFKGPCAFICARRSFPQRGPCRKYPRRVFAD
jgi:hypothetical protein